ncbi:MAG: PIN domain-containing protein [Deltaproteobacteria bacterium]|nr:PIN domain-containing protein [Deltaproteobacteria bacterium]
MKTFVDTSVWISFFRGKDFALVGVLDALLDEDQVALAAPVRLELLLGARRAEQARLRRLVDALSTFKPSDATWDTLDDWALFTKARGQTFGFGDLLIGAIASEHGGSVWSLDSDFERLAQLKLVKLYSP